MVNTNLKPKHYQPRPGRDSNPQPSGRRRSDLVQTTIEVSLLLGFTEAPEKYRILDSAYCMTEILFLNQNAVLSNSPFINSIIIQMSFKFVFFLFVFVTFVWR